MSIMHQLRGIPIDMLRHGSTHVVSASGRYLGFLTMQPEHPYTVWELQVFEPKSAADVQLCLDGNESDEVAYRILTLRRRVEKFNAGKRGVFSVLQYEVAPGEEKLLWDLEPQMFISAGELLGEKVSDYLHGRPAWISLAP